ncbi:hypothetical protein SBA4_210006 [Candidatus Sulfopaludibacter sp. SbA4]|nr:hypothetical protein SBA4_210006 [Candidatus Sulfopaludibacter sp. SbA4]
MRRHGLGVSDDHAGVPVGQREDRAPELRQGDSADHFCLVSAHHHRGVEGPARVVGQASRPVCLRTGILPPSLGSSLPEEFWPIAAMTALGSQDYPTVN